MLDGIITLIKGLSAALGGLKFVRGRALSPQVGLLKTIERQCHLRFIVLATVAL